MNRLSRLWKRVFGFISKFYVLARNVATTIALLTALGLGSVITGALVAHRQLIFFGLGVILSVIVFAIVIYTLLFEHRSSSFRKDTAYPDPIEHSDVRVITKDVVYEYFDDTHLRQKKRFILSAVRDHVTFFPDRYKWTGVGSCSLSSQTPGFRVANERKHEFWDYFDVYFPTPLRIGECVDFVVQWDLVDEQRQAVPFLSTMVDFETSHLRLTVVLPEALKPNKVLAHEFKNYIDTLPIATVELEWNPIQHSATYEIKNPILYHKYMISWY